MYKKYLSQIKLERLERLLIMEVMVIILVQRRKLMI